MISIDHVSFGYGEAQETLSQVSAAIAPGECVLLCGASGCGKTTLTRLLNGLIPHYHEGTFTGSVYLGGKDTRDLSLFEISQMVGSVFQNPRSQFFNVDTTSELAFGPENHGLPEKAVRERVRLVAEQLRLESLLDRSIFSLSGGEKQRISIARAILKDAPIVILDEATSALDNESEHLVSQSLERLASGRTTLTIAHRLTTIRNADRILVLSGSNIIEEGNHEELIEKQGIYYQLYTSAGEAEQESKMEMKENSR